MEQPETPKYATLFYDIKKQLNISFMEYILLDMVYRLSYRTGYCYKTPLMMSEDLGLSKRNINRMVNRLIEKNLLERLTKGTMRVTEVYAATQLSGTKSPTTEVRKWDKKSQSGTKSPASGTKVVQQQGDRITKNNNRDIINGNNYNEETPEEYRRRKAREFGVDTWQ